MEKMEEEKAEMKSKTARQQRAEVLSLFLHF
jgi:hypothetical protein